MRPQFTILPGARRAFALGCALLIIGLTGQLSGRGESAPPNSLASHDSSGWEKEIAAFEAADRTNRPPSGCIVFVGSSSIRLWKSLATDFPGLPVVNRGFGGSQIADSVNLAERVILPYNPRQVVVYAGGNDIHAGKDPDVVYGDFVALMTKLRARLPEARLAYIDRAEPKPMGRGREGQTPEFAGRIVLPKPPH